MTARRASLPIALVAALGAVVGAWGCEGEKLQAYPEELAGIGVVVTSSPDGHVISRVIAGGPAESAGVRAGARLLEVDGTPTTGKNLATIVASLRGREGSAVLLKVQDDGGAAAVVSVTRKLLARKGNDYQAR